tara:strand:- start:609 stop:1094 length:486 start_codon:yes stop_codon:yes gene_type:complete
MKTKELLNLLKDHPNHQLLFEYTTGKLVAPNYHITEVKNTIIDSVDCGAGSDHWNETVIQLWESPTEKDKREYMTAYKALGILNKVDSIRSMDKEAVVKFEYSNPDFHTAQLFVNDVEDQNGQLIMKLGIAKTDCKAKDVCGVPVAIVTETAECTPGGGCC